MATEEKDVRRVLNDMRGTLHRGWLPANVAAIVERQAAGVEEAHRAISDLKHGRTAMAASRI